MAACYVRRLNSRRPAENWPPCRNRLASTGWTPCSGRSPLGSGKGVSGGGPPLLGAALLAFPPMQQCFHNKGNKGAYLVILECFYKEPSFVNCMMNCLK